MTKTKKTMRIQINDKWIIVPSSLSEITLQQRIDFQQQHGNLLMEMEKSLETIEDEDDCELEQAQLNLEKMFRSMSFFTNCTVDALKESHVINDVVAIYVNSLDLVFKQEQELIDNPLYEFTWKGVEWEIQQPELKHGNKMMFGEFIDSKQVIQNMVGLGKNRWECLVPLCAIYLRKKGEKYQESFANEDSDRQREMRSLPLDIALQVGFFLSSSLNTFISTFRSFTIPKSTETVPT